MMKMTTRTIARLLSTVILLAAWHSSIPAANAQQPAPELSTPAPSISDDKLDAAAAALQQVAAIHQAYRQRFAQAATPSDQDRIVAEAKDALTKAVKDQGLSVDEYNSIIETAQNDPEVRGKVLQRIQPHGGQK
jgi:predicted TIM-barrel fold metal-dependent hydrolase